MSVFNGSVQIREGNIFVDFLLLYVIIRKVKFLWHTKLGINGTTGHAQAKQALPQCGFL